MKTNLLFTSILFAFFLLSCSQEHKAERTSDQSNENAEASTVDMASAVSESKAKDAASESISSSAAVETNKNGNRKFIRTADLKFKVKSVVKATYGIEDIVGQQGGFVSYTNLYSTIDYVNSTAISADSTLETTYFTVLNSMTIRIPNTKLDTTLKAIAKHIDYLDHRIITADDVALQLLSNDLTQKRADKTERRLTNAIDNRGKRLNETVASEEILANKQEQSDNAKIANMALNDQIDFSTITISMYQRQDIKRDVIADFKNITAYEPGFGKKVIESLISGWQILEVTILFLLNLWGLILAAVAVFFLYRFVAPKFRK
ncbi:DUF4349 domain-containing protein [uncultured Cytophaga sp.]|uniref:DUF4349 domain-containing protein n=1 Tax=uncultured Cytophaga sp. TaxID=160238 RepID=UPI00260C71AB|nr:DUF4349 domain-containing protein [uncultured Cytophaga sp.]